MSRALIVVDVQNDFCPDGSLAVTGGDLVAARITEYLHEFADDYPVRIATKDWHPPHWRDVVGFDHFSDTPDYVDTWPPHCIAGTPGARFHPFLDTNYIDQVFLKGQRSAAYSGFEAVAPDQVSLYEYLRVWDATEVHVVGLATDYCVKATAVDAAANGFDTTVIRLLTAAVNPDNEAAVLEQLTTEHQIAILA